MDAGQLRALLHPLAAVDRRAAAAGALAHALGAAQALLYVRDPALDVMLPAPGLPKTLAGGPAWREFLRRCLWEPRPQGRVDLPPGAEVEAQAVCVDGAALVIIGARQPPQVLDTLEGELGLLAALLNAQQALQLERAEAAEAREAAERARTLARALDTARAASAELNLQLRHEHERKDEFLAMLAHELRNPLAPLVSSIEILRRRAGDDTLAARQLDVMARQLGQLTHLVDDLLDVSRVSRGLIELRRERLALDEILLDAFEAARPLIEARAHTLQRSVPSGVHVNGDRVRLAQVFVNLLANAARYTEPGGRMAVSVVTDQRRVSVVVQDNGIGIPQHMLGRIFDMFAQVRSTGDRSYGGLGVGLTLASRLVELHGGRISAYSRGEGQGSTFTVSLPQLDPLPVRAPERPAAGEAGQPAAVAGHARVLVVDDNQDGAETLGAMLELMGAETRVAHDGEAALRLAQAFDPHLILLDIGLPGMDGYETARRLRRLPGLRARLVALTGYGSQQDRERALEAGFDEHCVKPLPPESALAMLKGLPAMHVPS